MYREPSYYYFFLCETLTELGRAQVPTVSFAAGETSAERYS